MLIKLMKHELRATGRIMLPLFILVLLTAAAANISTRILLEVDSNVLNTLGVLIVTAFALAIAAVCIVAFFLMIQRFYKNLLQDEGYIMMTLPVSVHQHIFSKLLVSMLWFVLSIAVIVLAMTILAYEVGLVERFFRGLRLMLEELAVAEYTFDAVIVGIEIIFIGFFSVASYCLNFYLAMAIGQSFSSKKVLMSIVAFFVLQFILKTLGISMLSILGNSTMGMTAFMDSTSATAATQAVLLIAIAACFVSAAVLYIPTAWLLKNRLNLE